MYISPELIISILALLISIYSISSKCRKCDKPTDAAPNSNKDTDKMSLFPAGKPKSKEIVFFLTCILSCVVVLQGLETLFAMVGLPFTNNSCVTATCFVSIFFTFIYCDDRYVHYLYPADKNRNDTDDNTPLTTQAFLSGLRVVSFICVGAFILAVVVTLVVEYGKLT